MKHTIRRAAILVVVLLTAYFLAWPVPINPSAWMPPVAPELNGVYAQNSELSKIERLPVDGFAPEDVAIDDQDRIYCGTEDGRIFRFQLDGTRPEVFANTPGRPLGLIFDHDGNLIVADAVKGLLSTDRNGKIAVLSTQADGVPFRCPNDLDVAEDGTIYFTDSSYKFLLTELKADILEHQPNGRLLAFDSRTKETRVVLRDLYFPNGVAVSPDQSFVLVCETGSYRVRRVWISGPKAGQSEIFINNLPGFPDGISSNGHDKFWLPNFLQPNIKRYAFVLGLDTEGHVVQNLQDPSAECFAQISNAVEHKGELYFGSIGENAIGRLRLTNSK